MCGAQRQKHGLEETPCDSFRRINVPGLILMDLHRLASDKAYSVTELADVMITFLCQTFIAGGLSEAHLRVMVVSRYQKLVARRQEKAPRVQLATSMPNVPAPRGKR